MSGLSVPSDRLALSFADDLPRQTVIKVLGLGGAGCNAITRMVDSGLRGVQFIAANTDAQSLAQCKAPVKLQLGTDLTGGLGAGAETRIGREAALHDTERIIDLLEGADLVFLAAGLGGGTGTGAIPVVGTLAKALGPLTIAVVTKPFTFEGRARLRTAEEGLERLKDCVDTVVTVLNERLLEVLPPGTTLDTALDYADDVLRKAVQGTSDVINFPGRLHLDLARVRSVFAEMGGALMGTGVSDGQDRLTRATFEAIHHPLLERISLRDARGVLINITGSQDLQLEEVSEACGLLWDSVDPLARVEVGSVLDDSLEGEVHVTVIATGIDSLPFEPGLQSVPYDPTPEDPSSSPTPSPSRRPLVDIDDLEVPAVARKFQDLGE